MPAMALGLGPQHLCPPPSLLTETDGAFSTPGRPGSLERRWKSTWGPWHLLSCRVLSQVGWWSWGQGGRHTPHPCSPPYAHQHCRRCDITLPPTLLDHSSPAAPPGSEGAHVSARLCCSAQHHTDSSAHVLRKRCFGGLVWAWAPLMAEPAPPVPSTAYMVRSPLQLCMRLSKSCQELLPLTGWFLHCCTWPGQLERKKDRSVGWQGYVMGSVLARKEQAWPGYQGDEEEGPSAPPHNRVLVWHLGWLEEVPTQHPTPPPPPSPSPPLLHSFLVPSRT